MVLDLRPPMTSHGGYHGGSGVGGGGDHHHSHHPHHHHMDGEEDEQGGWNSRVAPLKNTGGKALRPHLGGKQSQGNSRFQYRH